MMIPERAAALRQPPRNLLQLLLGVAVGALLCTGCQRTESPAERVARAEQLLARGNYGAAEVELRTALQDTPGDRRALVALARASLQQGNLGETATHIGKAAAAGASAADVADLQARLYLQQGKFQALLDQLDDGKSPLAGAQRSLYRARALLGLKRVGEALAISNELLRSEPRMAAVRILRAECHAQLVNGDQALRELDAAVAADPNSAEAWMMRGQLQQQKGEPRAAMESWTRAMPLAPGQLSVAQQLGMYYSLEVLQVGSNDVAAARATHKHMASYFPQAEVTILSSARLALIDGDFDTAVATLHKLINGNPELDAAHTVLLSAMLAQGTLEQVHAELEVLAQRMPQAASLKAVSDILATLLKMGAGADRSDSYWMNMAAAQIALGQPALAELALDKAQALAKDPTQASSARAILQLRIGNYAQAVKQAEALLARHPDDAAMVVVVGRAYAGLQQYARADEYLGKAWASQPTREVAETLAQIRAQGKLPGRLAPLQAWLQDHPTDTRIRALYAEALADGGDSRAAAAEYERVAAAAPGNAAVLTRLAWLYSAHGDARALKTARAAWQTGSKRPEVADVYGWMLLQGGSIEEALKLLRPACEAACATWPQLRYHMAAALQRGGNDDEARRHLTALLAEVPEFADRAAAQQLLAQLQ